MIALIPVISQIINALVKGGQMKQEEAAAAQAALAAAEVQRDKTFSDFIQGTSNIIYTLVRNAIVVTIMVAFLYQPLELTLMDAINRLSQAGFIGMMFLSIIMWEFYGREALTVFASRSSRNGNGAPAAPPQPIPSVSPAPDRSPQNR